MDPAIAPMTLIEEAQRPHKDKDPNKRWLLESPLSWAVESLEPEPYKSSPNNSFLHLGCCYETQLKPPQQGQNMFSGS